MKQKIKKNLGFTLLELLVVISIITILTISFSKILFKGQNNRAQLEKRVNLIINEFEETKFNSLLGKVEKNFFLPQKRKLVFNSSQNSFILEKYYLTGANWEKIKTTKITRKGLIINDFYCSGLNDSSSTGSFNGSGEIIFEGRNIFLSGGDCSLLKFQKLEIDLKFNKFQEKIIFNTINGKIIKKLNH